MSIKKQKKYDDVEGTKATHRMTETQRKIISAIGIILFILTMSAVAYYIGVPLVANLENPEDFKKWVNSYGAYGWIVCVGMMILQIIVAIIPGGVFEVGAGYAYGTLIGGLLCTVGSVIGSFIVFNFVRFFGIKAVEVFFSLDKIRNLKFLHNKRKRNILAFIIFLIPGMPKDLLSYFMGLTDMELRTWMIISTVARIPAIFISTYSGSALSERNYVSGSVVLIVLLIGSLIGAIVYKRICKDNKKGTCE